MTLRELLIYAEGRSTAAWDHTASVLCLLFNTNRGKGQKPVSIEDFHPHRQRKRPKLTPKMLHSLKPMIEKMGRGK